MSEDRGAGDLPDEQRPADAGDPAPGRPEPSPEQPWLPPSEPPIVSPGAPSPDHPYPPSPFRDPPAPGGPPPGGSYLDNPYQRGSYQSGPSQSGRSVPGGYPGRANPADPGSPAESGSSGGGPPPAGPYPADRGGSYPGGSDPGGRSPGGPYPGGGHSGGGSPGDPYSGGSYGTYPTGPVPPGYRPGPGGPPDYLGQGYGAPPAPPPRRRRRVLWIVTAAATALVLGAGGVTAYSLLAGQSVALDTRVPADAVVFAEISLDPPAGQKVAALRFFRHFPNVQIREDSKDLVEGLIEPLLDNSEEKQKFEADIKPWLGKHVAFAVDAQGTTGEPIAILQSTDDAKARAGMTALVRDATAEVGYVVSDGLVVVARTQAAARTALDDARRDPLHGNATFRQDLESVPDDGVFTAWADLSKASGLSMAGSDSGPASGGTVLHGRVAASLRFTTTTADLIVRGMGLDQNQIEVSGEPAGPRLGTLPDDTVMALALSGADKAITQVYDAVADAGFDEPLKSFQEDTGLVLPDDLAVLVGTSTVAAVGGTADRPQYGLISRTDHLDAARAAAQRLLEALGDDSPVVVQPVSTGTVIASSPEYADKLSAPGTLGNTELFRTTMPDLAGSQFAFFVNVRRAAELGDAPANSPDAHISAVGFTAVADAGTATVHARMVVG